MNTIYKPKNSYLRVATATPDISIGDVAFNLKQIKHSYLSAVSKNVGLVVFPELSITGYSLGDTVRQNSLLSNAKTSLANLSELTINTETAMIVGLPLVKNGKLYNCAALLAKGKVQGIVTKSYLPNYSEFYEKRWYQSFSGTSTISVNGELVPFGQLLLFSIDDVPVGIEICEDMWVIDQPSRGLAKAGALIIANPSASPELVGKSAYRKQLVQMTSAIERVAYVYAGANWTESTTDTVNSGHCIIAENGTILAEKKPFSTDSNLLVTDIDIDHIIHDRLQDTSQAISTPAVNIDIQTKRHQTDLKRSIPRSYFLPENENSEQRSARLESVFEIQSYGLAKRMKATKINKIVLGLSGGLDSTLALLVAYRAAIILDLDPNKYIDALTMPGPASSDRTQANAISLANAIQVSSNTISIKDLVKLEQKALKHNSKQDVAYENIQARARTNLLFNYANKNGGLVLGTGDLSEIVLGWCTYGGDHLSHYNVNGGIPKTLIKDLVQYASQLSEFVTAKDILLDIINTPISPELTASKSGKISQETESIIGPYVLHDFYMYHVIRFGDAPEKISYLAAQAFKGLYSKEEINKWLAVFYQRFSHNQFKRSTLPDGPKVGSIALSPRGDWRMPSDMSSSLWQ